MYQVGNFHALFFIFTNLKGRWTFPIHFQCTETVAHRDPIFYSPKVTGVVHSKNSI